ncbi:MAG: hypothetical protein M3Y13_07740, partial [Armatimonadota bacterium]|nr:hypothetical protein [Armatimonadota bacterium]
MSKQNTPEWHEPVEVVIVEVDDPMEDMVEVGEVLLIEGPIDPVPLSMGPRGRQEYDPPRHIGGSPPDFGTRDEKPKDTMRDSIQDKVKDVTQKTQDAAQSVADKAQDITQKLSETASSAKTAVGGALDTVKSTTSNAVPAAKNVVGSAAGKTGLALWTIVQRSPLQAIVFFASLIWLIRSNSASDSQPPVSLGDAASKVGTVAGQVQAAAGNLSAQVQDHTQRGAGWFSRTLQE